MAAGPPSHPPHPGPDGHRRHRPSGRSAPPAEVGEVKGAARRRPGRGRRTGYHWARGSGAGIRGRLAPGSRSRLLSPRALSPPPPPSCFAQAANLAPAHTPGCRLSCQLFTPARGPSHRASFCSRLFRGLGRIIGERELGFCQSLEEWVRLEVGRGNGINVQDQ